MNSNHATSSFFILLLVTLASNKADAMLRPLALHRVKNIATLPARHMCSATPKQPRNSRLEPYYREITSVTIAILLADGIKSLIKDKCSNISIHPNGQENPKSSS